MKFQIVVLLCLAAALKADVSFSKQSSMCHCSNPYYKMYYAYKKAAAETCATFPAGTAGQASCIAAALGYLTNEGRAIKSDAIAKDFNNLPFVASCDPNLPVLAASDVFQWHGNFNYGDLDKSLSVYFDCIDKAMAADCDQQMLSNLRGCGN